MADARNFAKILKHGLLSTTALLDLYEIRGEEREGMESEHRPESVAIRHKKHGVAIIRDQKPMSVSGLMRSLTDATPREFFQFLNGRVFFWLTEQRLQTMNAAAAYRETDQAILVVDTASLLDEHSERVLLCPMNSGATKPFAHPRSIEMFRPIADFEWNGARPKANRVVELTITGGVPDIMRHVVRVERWRGGNRLGVIEPPYRKNSFK